MSLSPSLPRRHFILGGLSVILLPDTLQAAPTDVPRLHSRHVWAGNVNETILALNADVPVPIASISKLVTASVVTTYELDLQEKVRITQEDVVDSHHTKSGLDVGSVWTREQLLEWLLVASDNRAAAALARSHPGGKASFLRAMQLFATHMQLRSFSFGDSSGLSVNNKASARDLGILLVMLTLNPVIGKLSRQRYVGQRPNVNTFAHDRSITLLAGKTGFTSAAGQCLAQTEEFNGRRYAMVVLNARDKQARNQDMAALRAYTRRKSGGPSLSE